MMQASRSQSKESSDSGNYDNKTILFILSLFALGVIARALVFRDFGGFSNDDSAYVGMAKSILAGRGLYLDGDSSPHTLFPPGYSAFLALQKQLLGSFIDVKAFEYIFLTGIYSLLGVSLCRALRLEMKYTYIAVCFLSPVLILGAATLSIASEIWFSILVTCGMILCVRYWKTEHVLNLLLCNFFFAASYLVRPEGLAFFSSSILAVVLVIRRWAALRIGPGFCKRLFHILLSFAAPVAMLILPYIHFLYVNIGHVTISGKDSFNKQLVEGMFPSYAQQLASNSLSLLRVLFISPHFLGPVFSLLIILSLWAFVVNFRGLLKRGYPWGALVIVMAPVFIVLASLLRYLPWARAVYPLIPLLCIGCISLLSCQDRVSFDWLLKRDFSLALAVVASSLSIFLFAMIGGRFDENPKIYYQLVDGLSLNPGVESVYSRNSTIAQYNERIKVCTRIADCTPETKHALLSNSTHNSLSALGEWEANAIKSGQFLLEGKACKRSSMYARGKYRFAAFECK